MKCYLSAVCVFSVLVALSSAAPMPQSDQSGGSNTRLQTTNIVEGINNKIRLLRQYCPQIFQVIDNVIQNVTSTAFRVIGRAVLQSGGLGGGRSGSSGGGSTSKVTVVLPTFPPDEDYDDEEDTNEVGGSSSTTTTEASSAIESRLTAISDSPKESEASAVKVEPTTEVDGNPLKIVIETSTEGSTTTTPSEIEDLKTVDLPSSVGVSTGLNVDEAVSSIDKLIFMNTEEAKVSDVVTSTTEAVPEVSSDKAIASVDISAELITSNPIVLPDAVDVSADKTILEPVEITKSDEVELSVITSMQSDAVGATTEAASSSDSKETAMTSDETIEISSATESVVTSTEANSEGVKDISENEISIENNRINLFDTENINVDETSTEMAPFTSSPSELSREKRDVRVVRAAEAQQSDDQETAASGGNGPNPSDDLSNVDADDADRDKRYLPFGGSFGGHASGHAGGGSGNFLFDIIRRTADGAARAAGTVYRIATGTENSGLAITATSTATRTLTPQLVAGSGATEESDEKDNSPAGPGGVAEIDVAKAADGYTEGVPGPITRLFVLANRGLANLVQDLILRLAQTSERIVNFKARLVTALI